ncbi:hypothetical protein OCK74_01615 [Chitinophagaceae bacterium LB-8]|uniref:Uncharacterized protein n=1 Tax=Paraflavisolibacter caeni TaxID=2982496 RepID=A0A9X2XT27_9BACT|nr:hypothetical protein [Paraflavisolibacter caeni]MCU7547787.1 hypothetical protein [Paraflavisolibacter caeni]
MFFNKEKFEFKGIKYTPEFSMPKDDFDFCIEFYAKMRSLNKVYTKKDIKTISKGIGFDVTEYFHFPELNNKSIKDGEKIKLPETSIVYRFISPIENQDDEAKSIVSKYLDEEKVYTRTELEKLSLKAGVSLFARCKWAQYILVSENDIQYIMPSMQKT